MVKEPGKYAWSTYRATAGLGKKLDFLAVDWILEQFCADRGQTRKEYRGFVKAGLDAASPWNDLKGQCLLGDDPFLEKLLPLLKNNNALKEIPRVQRFTDRPAWNGNQWCEKTMTNSPPHVEKRGRILKLESPSSQHMKMAAFGLAVSMVM